MGTFFKTSDVWLSATSIYYKNNDSWNAISESQMAEYMANHVCVFGNMFHPLSIVGPNLVSGETAYLVAFCDGLDITTSATWSIVDGGEYATISNSGVITVLPNTSNRPVTFKAIYQGMSVIKTVILTYAGAESTTDDSGNTTTTTSTLVYNEDGSTTSSALTIFADAGGNVLGSCQTTVDTDSDGSYQSATKNYDENGSLVSGENKNGDTQGNVNTQGVVYDSEGNRTVVSYTVDTSNNPSGFKTYNENGVDTEYYAFDLTDGFILTIHFTIDFTKQPANQDQNLHNILNAKRADPSPWYGFQLRHVQGNKFITLGTQFSTGSNINTNLAGTSYQGSSDVHEFNLRITYNPNASRDSFVCYDIMKDTNVLTRNAIFSNIPELEYIKVSIGYALDINGAPYRYSNINLFDFSLAKYSSTLSEPVISSNGEHVVITCPTVGASIYYRLNQTGDYSLYASKIPLEADTIVEAYSVLGTLTSSVVSKNCIYTVGS